MLREVKLYGFLGKRFGKVHRFDIERPLDAIRALKANFKGFEAAFVKGKYQLVIGNSAVQEVIDLVLQGVGAIKIIPVVSGAGSGLGRVIVGAALIAFAYYDPLRLASGSMWLSTSMGMGVSLALGGISELLFPPPAQATRGTNYAFGGPLNTSDQGNPVPLLYGRLIVGSQVISSAFSTDQISVSA